MKLQSRALMYHDVVRNDGSASGLSGAGPEHYKLSWERFLEHLDEIARLPGATPAALDARDGAIEQFKGALLTFDDGGSSALDVGAELGRRGWRGYFFVTTGLIGTAGFVDANAIRELDRMGHAVGSHSVTHPHWMAALADDELLGQWRDSIEMLAELVGRPVRIASVPGGQFRRRVAVAASRAGISTLFVSEPVRTVRRVDTCLVVGRYSIRKSTGGREAALAAAGNGRLWLQQYLAWNARKPAKALGESNYDAVRRVLLGRGGKQRGS